MLLGKTKPEEDKEIRITLVHLLKDPDPDVRFSAVLVLGNIKSIETYIDSCMRSIESGPVNETKLNEILEILEHTK